MPMVNRSNIFQIYLDVKGTLPFVVRRDNWGSNYGLAIVNVELKRSRHLPISGGGPYGRAWGYALPPLDGSPMNEYWGSPSKPKLISCAGCYQWTLIKAIPASWKRLISSN
jgi:hypothetical protein